MEMCGREKEEITEFLEEHSRIRIADASKYIEAAAVPPPVNMSTRPSESDSDVRPRSAAPATSGCLLCRDFSDPDRVASQYPRQNLPRSHDQTGYLAEVLCSPFNSKTDKARAIFTWLHHNIAYDVEAFFGNRVKHVEPKDTIASGLAVCGGYAGLFAAIALKAGLEAVMVTGHGKGFGYTVTGPGEPIPPRKPEGHAWNAVRIDGGQWKLLDPCWGAGNVSNNQYNKHFSPIEFTMPNTEVGLKHFPSDERYFYREDGIVPTWEQYIIGPNGGEAVQLFSSLPDHGLSGPSFEPALKHISISSGQVVRFMFSKLCEHWDFEKNGSGKPYCMVLKINGVDGREGDWHAFETNDFWYWADVNARDLGAPGQKVHCYAVTTVNGEDARGMTRSEYLKKKGRCGMGFAGIADWELVR